MMRSDHHHTDHAQSRGADVDVGAASASPADAAVLARYQALLEQAVDAIFVADLEGRSLEVNPAACALLGYPRAELLTLRIRDLLPADEVSRLKAAREQLVGGQTHRGEWRLRRRDGQLVPVEVSARIMPDGRWQAIARDITERTRLEAELRQAQRELATAEARFRAVVEQIPDALITVDGHGHITLVNRQTEALFGYPRAALLGQPIERLMPTRFHTIHRAERAAYEAHPRVRPMGAQLELWGQRADGGEFPIDVGLGPIHMDGETQVIATCRDATERKRVERVLRQQSEQLTRTFEAMDDGVYIYDRAGHLVQMNAAARAFSGYDAHPELMRESAHERMRRLQPRDAAGHPVPPEIWPFTRVLRGEVISHTAPVELVITTPTGREVFQHITGAPFHDAEGHVVGAVMVSRDMTTQRQLERQRTDILRVVAHDLANPLTAIKLYLQTQQRSAQRGRPPRPLDPEYLASMTRSVERMQRLLGDMRVVVGLEANVLSIEPRPCDLAALCQQEAQAARLATERTIETQLPEKPIMVAADRDRLGQVLANLLSNADKYSPIERPVVLTLRVERAKVTTPGAKRKTIQRARVLVHDEGPGIPPSELEHIWERFHRVHGVQARPGTGGSLGLGLYISREIVERHGGTMGVESQPGQGSTFWLTLPLAPRSTLASDRAS